MNSEMELTEKIELYLNGELNEADRIAFEKLRSENALVDQKVIEHKQFLKELSEYSKRNKLVSAMNKIHSEINVSELRTNTSKIPAKILNLWRSNRINTAIAASVAIIAVLLTLFTTGYFSKKVSSDYSALRREMIYNIKRSQDAIIKNINDKPKGPTGPGHFAGTGFALSSDGYILTNYHVIDGADSIYVQNTDGVSYKVKPVYNDPAYDLSVLQIIDSNFKSKSLPYTFKKTVSSLGEDVYTYGFPGDAGVYNKGYVSSLTGYSGDTLAYRIDIALNPGNSGGPVLDSKGNVIGIVTGKQTQADGVYFAVKSNYLLKSINLIPQETLDKKIIVNKRNSLIGLSRQDQLKKLQEFVYMVKAY